MSEVTPTMSSLFTALQASYQTAEASDGSGLSGDWPDAPGLHNCLLTGFEKTEGKTKIRDVEYPCIWLNFTYQTIVDENAPDYEPNAKPKTFRGKGFSLVSPDVVAKLDDKAQTGIRMDMERLKGHMSALTDAGDNLAAAIDEVETLVAGDSAVAVQLNITHREWKGSIYKTDFVKQRIS